MAGIAQSIIAELEQEAAATRRVLESVPADRLDWQPHPKSMTLGQLALHTATIPGNIARILRLDGMDFSTRSPTPAIPESVDELLPKLEAGLEEARAFLSELDETSAQALWRLTLGERELFCRPRLAVVRSLMLNHWYHHRGQLSVYLRLLDIPVPAIYGRSADVNPFADALEA